MTTACLSKHNYEAAVARTRTARMKWWHEARYGMFVHWGLYALLGRQEWVKDIECIPTEEYVKLMAKFRPKPRPAREWARLAVDSGMKYMVLTTKHHEGFCLWDTKQTDFNAVRACGRDLVREYVDACREFGLRIGFYYSLMDWNHPDGGRCAYDSKARQRFVAFTHGCVRELMSQYGKIDILWYDVSRPLASYEGWDSLTMNQMVRSLQPNIIINNRSKLDEDFETPEEKLEAAANGRMWESCMTFNGVSWGYMPSAAIDAHGPRAILKMLNTACTGAGNLLLNIGPKPDGSVPEDAVEPLRTVGRWLKSNGEAAYGHLDAAPQWVSPLGGASRRGRTLYLWCRYWPGKEIVLGWYTTKLRKATILATGTVIAFEQDGPRIKFKNLPARNPDRHAGVTVLKLEFVSEPIPTRHATTPAYGE
jgi:alpha-L-fucosidase